MSTNAQPACAKWIGPAESFAIGFDEAHLRVEVLRVGLADGVGEIEEDARRERLGVAPAPLAEDALDERREVDAERRGAHEDVALAEEIRNRAALGVVAAGSRK